MITLGTIQLPDPEFNDVHLYTKQRVFRETQGGTLHSYSNASWPTTDTYKYRFTWLTKTQRDDFFTFCLANLGKVVTLVDHLGVSQDGILTNLSEDSATTSSKDATCEKPRHTVQFDFEVV